MCSRTQNGNSRQKKKRKKKKKSCCREPCRNVAEWMVGMGMGRGRGSNLTGGQEQASKPWSNTAAQHPNARAGNPTRSSPKFPSRLPLPVQVASSASATTSDAAPTPVRRTARLTLVGCAIIVHTAHRMLPLPTWQHRPPQRSTSRRARSRRACQLLASTVDSKGNTVAPRPCCVLTTEVAPLG